MKVAILLCVVSCAFGLQGPNPVPAAYAPTAQAVPCAAAVQAAPFAASLVGAPVPFGAGVPAPVPVNPALMARLRPRVDQWTTTYTTGTTDALSSMFTTDAVISPDHDYSYYGRTGAKKWATKYRPMNYVTGPIQIMDIKDGGTYLLMRGNQRDAKGNGDIVMIWTDVNGQLLIKYMVYNWDVPSVPTQYDDLGTATVKQRVMTRMNEWSRLYEAGDIEGVSNMYYEFAKVFPYNDWKYDGPEGARKVYQDTRDAGITKTTYMVMEADQVGNTITAWCYYRDYKGTEMTEEGTDLLVFMDMGGQLMIVYDSYNQEWDESKRTADQKLAQEYYDDWATLFNANNIAGVVAKYEPDGMRILTGMPLYAGAPAIQQQMQTDYNTGNRYKMEVFTAMQVGGYMFTTGRQQTLRNDMVTTEGTFVDVLRMVAGKPKHIWDTYAIN